MKTIFLTFILVFLASTGFADDDPRTITVYGSHTLTEKAGYSRLHSELKAISPTIEESYQSVQATIQELLGNLKDFGLAEEHLVISAITQGAEYEWRNKTRELKGYYSTCSLQIKVVDMDKIRHVYKELSRYPSLTIGHSQYGRDDEPQLRLGALQIALQLSKDKAKAMAATLDANIGQALHIRESGASGPVHRPEMMSTARMAESAPAGTFGAITIQVGVSVEFELVNRE